MTPLDVMKFIKSNPTELFNSADLVEKSIDSQKNLQNELERNSIISTPIGVRFVGFVQLVVAG